MSEPTETVKDPLPITHAQFRMLGMDSVPLFTRNGETILACRDDLFSAPVPSEVVLFQDSPVVVQWQVLDNEDMGTELESYRLWVGSHRLRLELGEKTRTETRKLLRWLKETCIRMGLCLMVEQDPSPDLPF